MAETLSSTGNHLHTIERFQRGSNQSGMREYNERLVLTLLRRHGALAKSDIARMTGLSAQTISVIMRQLEKDGLLQRGEPVRVKGKVGQPSVPMSLAADGAYFLGLKIGRRSADLVLINFTGQIVANVHQRYNYPIVDEIVRFARQAHEQLMAKLSAEQQLRVAGLGIGIPFEMWSWVETLGAPQSVMDAWRSIDLRERIATEFELPVYLQNDVTAACGAELVLGQANQLHDFIYLYIGYFIGGGIVINGSVFSGRQGNAGAMGSMPVIDHEGQFRQLIDVASIATLEQAVERRGGNSYQLLDSPDSWQLDDDLLEQWIDDCGRYLAFCIVSSMALLEFERALVDGWMPDRVRTRMVESIQQHLGDMNLAGIETPAVSAGTLGADARAMGAAILPLAMKFLVDQHTFVQQP